MCMLALLIGKLRDSTSAPRRAVCLTALPSHELCVANLGIYNIEILELSIDFLGLPTDGNWLCR